MLTIILIWLFLFFVIYLFGRLFVKNGAEWYEYFWIGLAFLFAILQVWSIFLPVNIYALFSVVTLGCVSLIIIIRKGIKLPRIKLSYIVVIVLILLSVSYFASLSGGWPDTLGYHLTSVKWGNTSRVVPGLANLYSRLGFNSSFFLFASMLDNLFLKDRVSHIALSLLTSVLILEYVWVYLKSNDIYLKIFLLFSAPAIIEGVVHSVQVSSLSYDFALLIIILTICVELIKNTKFSRFLAIILSSLLITIKLSGIVFAAAVLIYVLYTNLLEKNNKVNILIKNSLLGVIFIIPYVVRNVILTGWPLYPMPLFGFNLPWSMPKERLVDLVNVIKGWAIIGGQWRTVVGVSIVQWFPGWLSRNWERIELKLFALAVLFLIISLIYKFINKKIIKKNIGLAICGLAAFLSVVYLLNFAPDLRFGGIYFWVFFAAIGPYFLIGFLKTERKILFVSVVVSIYLSFINSYPFRTDSVIMLKSVRWDQAGETHQIKINPSDKSPSFIVNTPIDTSSCGTVSLPCTSEPNYDFKEIIPGNMFGGYKPVN